MTSSIKLKDGFRNQIQYVIPQSVLARAKNHPLLYPLMITDIGWYPQARYHYRQRDEGATEHLLILGQSGSGWCEIGEQHYEVKKNQALLIPKGCPHRYGADEESPWTIHWVHFTGNIGDYLARQLPEETYILPVEEKAAIHAGGLFEECYQVLEDGFSTDTLVYCTQVLHHLLGILFFHNRHFFARLSRPRSNDTTLQFLQQNINRPLTLADMAQNAELSVAHFSALFKQQMGYSPVDYFIHTKIQRACFLLDTTSLSVREIGLQVGYQDSYYFSRIFRKVMGVSPRAYRHSRRTA